MPFEPGKSGNPSGTKREQKFAAALNRAVLADDGAKLRAAAEALLDAAAEGESWAIDQLANRLDGKPSQAVVVSGDDEAPPVSLRATVELIHARPLPATGDT